MPNTHATVSLLHVKFLWLVKYKYVLKHYWMCSSFCHPYSSSVWHSYYVWTCDFFNVKKAICWLKMVGDHYCWIAKLHMLKSLFKYCYFSVLSDDSWKVHRLQPFLAADQVVTYASRLRWNRFDIMLWKLRSWS